jgi:hypothetical protein
MRALLTAAVVSVSLAVTFVPGTLTTEPIGRPLTVSSGASVSAAERLADDAWYAHAEAVEAMEREAASQVGR